MPRISNIHTYIDEVLKTLNNVLNTSYEGPWIDREYR